ncbi:hypothetical protein BDY17DRAFT_311549 [Neohortaea acidophila]|uniref:Ubiquitination network signaling protein acrB n=1 Tax=Neohortaea acidophila TaxID=245834 RepID=A0A6A6PQ51_9PEZI|nr:uncharacterized protein BDY17DRAFT_311549 [Neohortaea acidophila]KAF2481926.1 hypothetical protein BDY17DRAFT_311549 [Neohortaea acidophila]
MPPKGKLKNAPNQHDKRHETGLAQPGKRVVKSASNGQPVAAHANGKIASTLPPSTTLLPATALAQQSSAHPALTPDSSDPGDFTPDHATTPEDTERESVAADPPPDDAGSGVDMGDVQSEPAHAATPAEATAPEVRRDTYSSTTAVTPPAVSTLLPYYPLRDAIALLILLLSLPPTLVLVIQTLFASLTFVPPTASISIATLPNIKEMFNSSNFGYPAMATILIVDLIFWVCWLPVWKPIQNIFLDLSQAVIAISLSGAAAGTGGPTYSIATCTAIVCAVHVLRYKAIHLTALDYLRSVLHKAALDMQFDVPLFVSNITSPPSVDRGWFHTIVHTILGIHIVSQGVTTCVRRILVQANQQSAGVPAITKSDAEAVVGSESNTRSGSVGAEAAPYHNTAQTLDATQNKSLSTHRDGKIRESATKKKRKQANQVRSQQPLWAAIASTKVTFVKEMEHRDAFDDAREAARMQSDSGTIPSHSTQTTGRIWVCEVRDTEILFSVEVPRTTTQWTGQEAEDASSQAAGIDKSKPFYIRVNGAAWRSVRISSNTVNDAFAADDDRYDGEIFGLAPLSSYCCEIVSAATHQVLCCASMITQAAPTDEQAATASSQAPHQAFRPSSPTTTLKQSIQQAEAKLNETRNRTRKNKKDQRAMHSDIKREIHTLRSKLESSGGTDDKQERRLMQITQHKNQAEEAAAEIKQQIEALGVIPEDTITESEGKRRKWQAALDAKDAASKAFDRARNEADRETSALKSEISQTESKLERVAARLTQRTQEFDALVSKQQADSSAKQRREVERAQTVQRREDEESQFRHHIATFEMELASVQQKAQDAYQEIASLQSWPTSSQNAAYATGYSSPPTPDNAFPHTARNGSISSPHQLNGFPANQFGPHPPAHSYQTPHHSAHPSFSINNTHQQAGAAARGRSSSMLSQYSGFTDNGDEYAFAPEHLHQQQHQPHQQPHIRAPHYSSPPTAAAVENTHAVLGADRSGSASVASGSAGSNSPRPSDARPPFAVKPIGPPGKGKEKMGMWHVENSSGAP